MSPAFAAGDPALGRKLHADSDVGENAVNSGSLSRRVESAVSRPVTSLIAPRGFDQYRLFFSTLPRPSAEASGMLRPYTAFLAMMQLTNRLFFDDGSPFEAGPNMVTP